MRFSLHCGSFVYDNFDGKEFVFDGVFEIHGLKYCAVRHYKLLCNKNILSKFVRDFQQKQQTGDLSKAFVEFA